MSFCTWHWQFACSTLPNIPPHFSTKGEIFVYIYPIDNFFYGGESQFVRLVVGCILLNCVIATHSNHNLNLLHHIVQYVRMLGLCLKFKNTSTSMAMSMACLFTHSIINSHFSSCLPSYILFTTEIHDFMNYIHNSHFTRFRCNPKLEFWFWSSRFTAHGSRLTSVGRPSLSLSFGLVYKW